MVGLPRRHVTQRCRHVTQRCLRAARDAACASLPRVKDVFSFALWYNEGAVSARGLQTARCVHTPRPLVRAPAPLSSAAPLRAAGGRPPSERRSGRPRRSSQHTYSSRRDEASRVVHRHYHLVGAAGLDGRLLGREHQRILEGGAPCLLHGLPTDVPGSAAHLLLLRCL